MIDIIYKTVKLSHLKKLLVILDINNLMSQVIFIFSDLILKNQIIVSSTCFGFWEKQISEKILPGGMSSFLLDRM